MAKFYRPRGHQEPAVKWDPEKGKPAYEFFQGVLETEDKKQIKMLRELDFPEEPVSINIQASMDRNKDAMIPPPAPPPKEGTVPKMEPDMHLTPPKAPALAAPEA